MTNLLLGAALLLLASVLASKASARFGFPALLVFLTIGMVAGSEGPGGIHFDDFRLTQAIGTVALAFILFSGGLDTSWRSVRPVLLPGLGLATVGVAISAVILALTTSLLLDLTPLEALLLGAVLSSTDAAAVFAILRSRGVRLRGNLRPLAELESGSNDPMAVFLTTALIAFQQNPEIGAGGFALRFALEMGVGSVAGFLIGKGAVRLLNRLHLEYDGLYPVLMIGVVLFAYAAPTTVGGNGFLSVYVAGIAIGNTPFVHRASLLRFHDGLAWLMQITMFLSLGLLVFPSRLVPVMGKGLLVALALTFVARPLSVLLCLAPTRMSIREKLLISWTGLRGAVPIILATFPMTAGLPHGEVFFNVVFFSVVVSVVLQGSSIPLVARWLRVADEPDARSFETRLPASPDSELVTIRVPAGSFASGRQLLELGLPDDAVVLLIHREGGFFAPTGGTVIRPDDKIMILTSRLAASEVRERLGETV